MDKQYYLYIIWQCLLVFFSGIVGLIGIYLTTNLPRDIAVLFTLIFICCIIVALFFLVWIRFKRKQEMEDKLIDSIGEAE